MTLMIKLFNIDVTNHTPQNEVSATLTHVTVNTTNGVILDFASIILCLLMDVTLDHMDDIVGKTGLAFCCFQYLHPFFVSQNPLCSPTPRCLAIHEQAPAYQMIRSSWRGEVS